MVIIHPGHTYNIMANGYYQDRVAYSLCIYASIDNFDNNVWLQKNLDSLTTEEILSQPNWIDFTFFLNNANSTHNINSPYNISYSWIPNDLRAFRKVNGIIYSVTRQNGSMIYLNDSDVTLRLQTKMVTYSRNETQHIMVINVIALIPIIIIYAILMNITNIILYLSL